MGNEVSYQPDKKQRGQVSQAEVRTLREQVTRLQQQLQHQQGANVFDQLHPNVMTVIESLSNINAPQITQAQWHQYEMIRPHLQAMAANNQAGSSVARTTLHTDVLHCASTPSVFGTGALPTWGTNDNWQGQRDMEGGPRYGESGQRGARGILQGSSHGGHSESDKGHGRRDRGHGGYDRVGNGRGRHGSDSAQRGHGGSDSGHDRVGNGRGGHGDRGRGGGDRGRGRGSYSGQEGHGRGNRGREDHGSDSSQGGHGRGYRGRGRGYRGRGGDGDSDRSHEVPGGGDKTPFQKNDRGRRGRGEGSRGHSVDRNHGSNTPTVIADKDRRDSKDCGDTKGNYGKEKQHRAGKQNKPKKTDPVGAKKFLDTLTEKSGQPSSSITIQQLKEAMLQLEENKPEKSQQTAAPVATQELEQSKNKLQDNTDAEKLQQIIKLLQLNDAMLQVTQNETGKSQTHLSEFTMQQLNQALSNFVENAPEKLNTEKPSAGKKKKKVNNQQQMTTEIKELNNSQQMTNETKKLNNSQQMTSDVQQFHKPNNLNDLISNDSLVDLSECHEYFQQKVEKESKQLNLDIIAPRTEDIVTLRARFSLISQDEIRASLPEYWVLRGFPMLTRHITPEIDPNSMDYIELSNAFIKSAPTLKIRAILRVENAFLWHHFQAKKQELNAALGGEPLELQLYHGPRDIETTLESGFGWTYTHRPRPHKYNHRIALTTYAANACQHCRTTRKVIVATSLQAQRNFSNVDLMTDDLEPSAPTESNLLHLLNDFSSYPSYVIEWEGELPPPAPKQATNAKKSE